MQEKDKEVKCLRYVLPKNETNRLHVLQAIIYTDGSCSVGIDLWRDLSKHDSASHPITDYANKYMFFQNYDLVRGKVNRTPNWVQERRKNVK